MKNHGGARQAVYAYAREDLDWWQAQLGRELTSGSFGENLTTAAVDVTGARLGERWRIGPEVVLEVSGPRIPCATFAVWMGEPGWLKSFIARARPGAYLRVWRAGEVHGGDEIEVVSRPDHDVSIGLCFRALTREPELLPELLAAGAFLEDEIAERARNRRPFEIEE